MVYVLIFLVLSSVMIFFAWHVIRYRNPYKLYMVFGNKGSGKTTLMTRLALSYQKKGWSVYCDREIPGVHVFKTDDFGRFRFPENSLVLVDEVGLVWDNRNFKSFPEHVKVYFKYQRQYRNVVYLFSQSFDVDKKIRDLTDHLYIVQNFFNCFSIARRVTKHLTVVHADKSAAGESKIVDDYTIDPLWKCFFGSVLITYIPKYAKFFRSFDPPALPDLDCPVFPAPELTPWRQTLVGAMKERRAFLKALRRK